VVCHSWAVFVACSSSSADKLSAHTLHFKLLDTVHKWIWFSCCSCLTARVWPLCFCTHGLHWFDLASISHTSHMMSRASHVP